jgi:hypothetical protein
MSTLLVRLVLLILAVAVVSGVYAFLRANTLTTPDQLAAKGLEGARWDTAVFFAGVAAVVGVLGVLVFRWMGGAATPNAARSFLLLALGIGLALEIMAAVVFKMRGLADFTVLHMVQIVGFGWLLPLAYIA